MNNMSDFVIEDGSILTKYVGVEQNVVIPEGITIIDYQAFNPFVRPEFDDIDFDVDNKFTLLSVKLPSTLQIINSNAFEACDCLKEIVVPKSVESIEADAFLDCCSLEKIVILNADCDIDSNGAFEGCPDELIVYSVDTGKEISSVEQYALDNHIRFRPL